MSPVSIEPLWERVYHSSKGQTYQQRRAMQFIQVIFILGAYLVGSVSAAILVCRLTGKTDPRQVGSKNPGATNVYRTVGKEAAALTLVGDILKGVIPVWLASLAGLDTISQVLVAMAALVGHCFPVFFQFKGGKGVATVFGGLLMVHWAIGLSLLAIWVCIFILSRTSSLSAIIAALTVPLSSYYVLPEAILPLSVIAVIVLWRHYDNILKLLQGDEDTFRKP